VEEQLGQVIKRKIFVDKKLDVALLKMFTDLFIHAPDQTDIL
jgi:hypothetical protein